MSVHSTEEVLTHHLNSFAAGDVDEIMTDYTPESVVLTPDGAMRGPEQIRPLFQDFVTNLLPPGSPFEMKQMLIDGEMAYILWSAESDNFTFTLGTDTFIIRDGKIIQQTFAAQVEPKNA